MFPNTLRACVCFVGTSWCAGTTRLNVLFALILSVTQQTSSVTAPTESLFETLVKDSIEPRSWQFPPRKTHTSLFSPMVMVMDFNFQATTRKLMLIPLSLLL